MTWLLSEQRSQVRTPEGGFLMIVIPQNHGNELDLRVEDANSTSSKIAPMNLCSAQDMCTHLCRHSQPHSTLGAGSYVISYLDTPDDFRHYLYPVCDPKECLSTRSVGEPAPLNSIFTHAVDQTITVPQQINLAVKLVKGVLKFQSTPWLRPLWRLQDLSYFQTDEGLAASLGTLHFSTELSHHNLQDTVMTEAPQFTPTELVSNVQQPTLYSLGVALLQIGRWSQLNPDDILKVGELAERDCRLGSRYQKVTRKCLECDFGFGEDLTQLDLQNAVYRDVVCELEDLVSMMEGTKVEVSRG